MSIFGSLKRDVRIDNSRADDKPGKYWQRIDGVTTPKTQAGVEYIRIAKTTVKVLDPSSDQEVGEETTQALFRDRFNYLEKDLMKILASIYGMSPSEASELTPEKIQELLMSEDVVGQVVEITVWQGVRKDGEPFVKCEWGRNVTDEVE